MALTLEQLAIRRRGIGASEIAAVAGLNPWASPISVYQAKVDILRPNNDNNATRHGKNFEPVVRETYGRRLNRQIIEPGTLEHPDNPLILATPDGISHGPEGSFLLEVKCPTYQGQFAWGQDGTDEVPDYHIPQVTWGMAVTGLKVAHFAALVYNEVRIYTVQYDHELFLALEKRAMEFWHKHVVPQIPPPVDESNAFSRWLKDRYKRDSGLTLAETPKLNRLVRDLKIARGKKKKAEARCQFLENKLKFEMGDHVALANAYGKITWSTNRDSKPVNWKGIAHDLSPQGKVADEILAKHTTVKPGARQFRVKFNDDDSDEKSEDAT